MTIEAEAHVSIASMQLAVFDFKQPVDAIFYKPNTLYLNMSLTPRLKNARACYCERWAAHRFEPLGDVFAAPAGEALHTLSDGGQQEAIICELRPEALRTWFDGALDAWTANRLETSLNIAEPRLRALLQRLSEEARHPGFASDALIELLAAQLAIELCRYCADMSARAAPQGLAPWRLRMIDERLREIREAPSLSELARMCGVSVRQLTRGFRISRGCSIGEYMQHARIKSAQQLLERDACIKSVAHALGFSSPSSFAYAFRRETGETPGAYRQRIRAR